MKKTVIIRDNESILRITLDDILDCIDRMDEFKWKIMWLKAMSSQKSISALKIEQMINDEDSGYLISSYDLRLFNKQFSQIIEIMIIGDKDVQKLRKYESDSSMRMNCAFCIELVDSNYWEVTTSNIATLNSITSKFPIIEFAD